MEHIIHKGKFKILLKNIIIYIFHNGQAVLLYSKCLVELLSSPVKRSVTHKVGGKFYLSRSEQTNMKVL